MVLTMFKQYIDALQRFATATPPPAPNEGELDTRRNAQQLLREAQQEVYERQQQYDRSQEANRTPKRGKSPLRPVASERRCTVRHSV